MATKAKSGSKNGIEWRTDSKGRVSYRWVLNTKATGKANGEWTTSHAEAKAGRTKALGEVQAGLRGKATGITLRDAWESFYAAAEKGGITDRSGNRFSPSTLRTYKRHWAHVEPELGAHKMSDIKRADLQALIDHWGEGGAAPATITNRIVHVRTLYRRAMERDQVFVNPTLNLRVPRVNNARERFATREEAAALIAALPSGERAVWATAFYGGLRRGELRALRWTDIDLAAGLIRVRRSWDDEKGERDETKSEAGDRRVPIVPQLHALLTSHQATTTRGGSDLVFGRTAVLPFVTSTVRSRARRAWKASDDARIKALGRPLLDGEGLTPITLHECRHTFASLMIDAGVNAKALQTVMGHKSITMTFDRYGKLMPGGETEAGLLLASYLDG